MEITTTLIMTARAVSFLRRWLKAVATITLTDWRMKSKPAAALKKQRSVVCMHMTIFASLRVKATFIIFPSTTYQSSSPVFWVSGKACGSHIVRSEKGRKIQQSPEPQRPVSIRQPLDLLCCCRNKGLCGRPSLSKESAIRKNTALSKPAVLAVEDRRCHYGNSMLG